MPDFKQDADRVEGVGESIQMVITGISRNNEVWLTKKTSEVVERSETAFPRTRWEYLPDHFLTATKERYTICPHP